MEPALVISSYWILFAGTHVGLAVPRVREPLVRALGHWGFTALFSVIAAITFALLFRAYAAHQAAGAVGLGPWLPGALRWVLYGVSALGTGIMVLAAIRYAGSPYAVGGAERYRRTRGIERISRHGFFAGVFLIAGAHALLASHLVGTVFWGIFALYCWLGSVHQDSKLIRQRGASHAKFVEETSFIPFGAILRGRQPTPWREVPALSWGLALVGVILVRLAHPNVLAAQGMVVVGIVVGGAAFATYKAWRIAGRD